MDCGFISKICRGFSPKGQGTARAAGQAGHVTAREWRVHGPRGGPRGRGVVHRSTVDRGGRAGGGAMAAPAELTTAGREGSASREKRTGGRCPRRRTRGARWTRRGTAKTRGPRVGTAPCRRRNYGERAWAHGSDRDERKKFGGFLTTVRSSGGGPRRLGRDCRRNRWRRAPSHDGGRDFGGSAT